MWNGSARDGLERGACDINREEAPERECGPSSTDKLPVFR